MKVTVGMLVGCLALSVAAYAAGTSQPAYGPCCPLVKGSAPTWKAIRAASGAATMRGPRHECKMLPSFALGYGDKMYKVNAMEVGDTVLVPARVLGITGANVEWLGGRNSEIVLGARKVRLTLGNQAVTMEEDGEQTNAVWDLCPRLMGGVTYVPLRATAEALGLTVTWEDGKTMLELREPVTAAAMVDCPATRVEAALGISVGRGPMSTPLGVGVGVIAVADDGRGAELGLKASDVIVGAAGKPTSCPRDLDAIVAEQQAAGMCLCKLDVVREGHKLTLQGPAKQQE